MKRFTILLATSAILILLVSSFSFPQKQSLKKEDEEETYYFTGSNQFIGSGNANELVQSEVTNTTNWTQTNPGYTFSNGSYLAAIKFKPSLVQLWKVILALWNYYNSNNKTLPADGQVIIVIIDGNNNEITINRKATN